MKGARSGRDTSTRVVESALCHAATTALRLAGRAAARRGDVHVLSHYLEAVAVLHTGHGHDPCMLTGDVAVGWAGDTLATRLRLPLVGP